MLHFMLGCPSGHKEAVLKTVWDEYPTKVRILYQALRFATEFYESGLTPLAYRQTERAVWRTVNGCAEITA